MGIVSRLDVLYRPVRSDEHPLSYMRKLALIPAPLIEIESNRRLSEKGVSPIADLVDTVERCKRNLELPQSRSTRISACRASLARHSILQSAAVPGECYLWRVLSQYGKQFLHPILEHLVFRTLCHAVHPCANAIQSDLSDLDLLTIAWEKING
jgi:hypothetical protein